MKNLYASIVICERVLNEVDGVLSAIRIADLFFFSIHPQIPIEQQAVPISAVVSVRVLEIDDLDHSVQLKLIRPNGEESAVGEPVKVKISQKFSGAPGGINSIANLGIVPKQMGQHRLVVIFDDEEVAETIFTLLPREELKIVPTTSSATTTMEPV